MYIYQNVTFRFNGSGSAAGVPIDLTGKVVTFNLRHQKELTPYFRVTSSAPTVNGSTLVVTDAVAGLFTVRLTPSDTATFLAGRSRFFMTLEDTDTRLFGRGDVTIGPA